jgi:LytR cell envelope-related transcriptional attenuator
MEIIQEIGSYAGFAAVIGLAVLAALYFSQARDVKRLREWAGRAPERPPVPAPGRQVVARPMARPAQPPAGGATPPSVPRPPGAPASGAGQAGAPASGAGQAGAPVPGLGQPGTGPASRPTGAPAAAQAAGAGATPAMAKGPAPATPAAGAVPGEPDSDADAQNTVVHPPPDPDQGDRPESDEPARDASIDADAGDGEAREPSATEGDSDGGVDSDTGEWTPEDGGAETGEWTPEDESSDTGEWSPEDESSETGEWSPEDEHSNLDFTDEHDAVPAATPVATAARPPQPPRPFPRRATPAAGSGHGRSDRGPILPPYAQSRPEPEEQSTSSTGGRRNALVAIVAVVVLGLAAFAALQLIGGDKDSASDGGGLAADPASDDGTPRETPIDPADVTVAVLNGTTVPGLAAQLGDKIAGQGFKLGTVTNNFDQERAESVVLFASGAEREAADVSRRLDIAQREPVDPDSQSLAGDATVVVVAGADQTQ